MSGATHTITLDGLAGRVVEVEADLSSAGLSQTVIVGLADATVNEARDRVRSATVNSGIGWPDHRITVNLAPSNVPKAGSHLDLAIAVAVCIALKKLPADAVAETVFFGELALDGRLRAVRGVLPAMLASVQAGFSRVFVPEANVAEAALVEGIDVVGVRSLGQVLALLTGGEEPDDPPVMPLEPPATDAAWSTPAQVAGLDFADVVGQADAALSAVVAAAGGHHLLMTGPPGIGKTMIAQRLPGLLPDLGHAESLEVSTVHSVMGMLPPDVPLLVRPPFIDPHHTASVPAMVGGGSRVVRPGLMSLAHRGVLFLDEAPEFAPKVLEALRQPLESGSVSVSRAANLLNFPARFQLVLAANPCPCGNFGAPGERCECTPLMRRRYADRLSGPIRDRIDIHRQLTTPNRRTLALELPHSALSTQTLRQVVAQARERQGRRYAGTRWTLNCEVPGPELRNHWPMTESARSLVEQQVASAKLSARAADRIMRLAWTVADICDHDRPDEDDVETALSLRRGTGLGGQLRTRLEAA